MVLAVKLIILWRSINTWYYKRALNIFGRVYSLLNQINAVIMRMRKCYWISACAWVYLKEVYFMMAAFQHRFWTGKLIKVWCLMISYRWQKCANWLLNTWSNIITWNQKLPSRSANLKCILAKRAWVAYWRCSEQGHT